MRQKKMENFLTVNSILAAAIAILTSSIFSNTQTISIILIIGISIIGSIISVTWYYIMLRNRKYMKFQRLQLCSIERALSKEITTFSKMYKAFDEGKKVNFPCFPELEPFTAKRKSANELEGYLPMIIAISWVVVAFGCVAFLIYFVTLS
jgi:hypothetical protein